jgi:cytochrome c
MISRFLDFKDYFIIVTKVMFSGTYLGTQRTQRTTKDTTSWPLCQLCVLRGPLFRLQNLVFITSIIFYLAACNKKQTAEFQRPRDPWAFRSVLDKLPRMLTVALDTECYVAYDLAHCTLYKAWKGGVSMEGAPYTSKKNVQPTTWGTSYFIDSLYPFKWNVEINGKKDSIQIVNKGYVFRDNQIFLKFLMILSSKDTVHIEERPEFIQSKNGKQGLERLFKTSGVSDGINISLQSRDTIFKLKANNTSRFISYFNTLPAQFLPEQKEQYDHRGRYYMEKSDCFTCHELDKKTVGPSLHQMAQRYKDDKNTVQYLISKVKEGGAGVWGISMMNAHPNLNEIEIKTMLDYIFSLKEKENIENDPEPEAQKVQTTKYVKPGFGAALEGLHPSYNISTLHKQDFQPRVGGLAFLPDGRLLVTTWDVVGGVYLLDGVETGDTNKITIKRIASGLAEPLGIEVVDGEIYVLQKQELTRLIDHDNDDIVDEYQAVCNSWGVSSDFHEFSFGLLYKDGHFYATLSLAMRLIGGEKQKSDRGKTIKISKDGSFEWINYGLRQPNGIGLGMDDEIFVTENQGEWIPANKLIHVKKGDYHGMPWGLPDPLSPPPTTPPAIWLPEDEIANSPSEPILMQDGPYKGQMLHGDVTHGGIKRDFLEKINGAYQGVVFRFTQGLEAGINRLCWGPDGALYIGGIGMVGGWSWKDKQYGLQRMKYNGKLTFEMLAVRAKPKGFEIEFTEALKPGQGTKTSDFLVQQWWYKPTADYGGPKMDLEKLKITRVTISEDRKRVYLEIPGLKKEHVVYFLLPENLQSASGQFLWSSEAWYTLNNIPE